MKNVKALVLFTVFIDIIGLGIIIPILPTYVQSFGVSSVVVTLLFAVYALFSFFSAPYLGALSDRIGRRPVLIMSIISSAIGWFVVAQAWNVVILFIGRIIDGLAAGNITTAQSALADIAKDSKERAVNMGLFGALFGVGFIIGPALGGFIALLGNHAPFYFVGILAAINAILAYFFLPETHHTRNHDKKISYNPFTPIIDGFKNREMRWIFLVWFLFGTALSVQQGTFSLYVQDIFGMSAQTTGLLFAGVGVLIVINQLVLLKKFWLVHFQQRTLALIMLVLFSIGMLFQSVPLMISFFIGLILTTFGQGNLRTVFGSIIAGHNENKRGEYLGISASIMSLSMIVGPLIATVTYPSHPGAPFLIAGILGFVGWGTLKYLER